MASSTIAQLTLPSGPKLEVLNPQPTSNLNFDYSYARKRPVTHLNSKARSGVATFRELTDVAHSFVLSWADRDLSTARQLKRFYEQYRGGAFVLIDHEGGGRQYVGRFTTPVEPMPTRNASWTIQSVQFDELPGVPMPVYPQSWDIDAVWMDPVDFLGRQQVTVQGAWVQAQDALARRGVDYVNAGANAGDWAQMQYLGYGFQLWGRSGPDMGMAQVWLDGVQIGTIDFYSAAATKAADLFSFPSVPFGMHRVKLSTTNGNNAASSGTTVCWDSLRVMR